MNVMMSMIMMVMMTTATIITVIQSPFSFGEFVIYNAVSVVCGWIF